MDVNASPTTSRPGSPEPNSRGPSPALRGTPHYSIETITTEHDLAALEGAWDRLSDTAALPNAFMTFDWFTLWNRRLSQKACRGGRRRRAHVLVLKRDGATAGISPLIHRTAARFGGVVRKLEFVGRQADYNDLVVGNDPEGQTEAIAEFLAKTHDQWDLLDLRAVRETGGTLPRIQRALASAGLIHRVLAEQERSPYLVIDAPGSDAVEKFSHGFRNTYRRVEQMKGEGLRIRIIENPQDESGLLAKMIAVEAGKVVGGKPARPFFALYRDEFQLLFNTLGPRGWLFVALMEVSDRPLAFQFGFRCGKKLWEYQTAYDHAFWRLSPGAMLIPAVLDYGFSHGYNEFDFLRGEESYKMRWATGLHQTYRVQIWSRCWTSRARAWVYLDLRPAVYRLFGRRE